MEKFQRVSKNDVVTMSFVGYDGVEFTMDLRIEMAMSEHTLNQCLLEQPGKYAWWATVYSDAKAVLEQEEFNLSILEAELGNEARDVIESQGGKATVANVKDYVLVQPQYKELKGSVIWWRGHVSKLKYVVGAFEQRSNSLAQLGAQLRADKKQV